MSIKKLGSIKLTEDILVGSTNLASEVTGILGVANGGTGQSVFTNGQLLIGNTTGNTLTKATLTEGSGISVTNGTGTITLATTAAQAHVTSLGTLTSLTVSGDLTVDTSTLKVDSANNRTLMGITTARNVGYGDAGRLNMEGTSYSGAAIAVVNNSNNADAPSLNFGKSRGTTTGSFTAVQSGDGLGVIDFVGANGSAFNVAARIVASVDGTVSGGGTNDMPGRLAFFTTADGSGSPTERMRIDSAGNLGLGVTPSAWTTSSGRKAIEIGSLGNAMFGNGASDFYMLSNAYRTASNFIYANNGPAAAYRHADAAHQWFSAASGTAGNAITFTQAMTLNASGNLGIGTTSPATALHLLGTLTVGNSTYSRPALTPTNWGYSASYRVMMIGSASTSYTTQNTGSVTVAFNYDPSGNANGSFNGDGREILFRNGTQFVTPNAANTSYNLFNLVLVDGNVGIGTSSPTAGYKLDVRGNVIIPTGNFYAAVNTANGNNWGLLRGDNSGNTIIGDAQTIYVTAGGNVGIGTSSPGGRLHVSAVSTNNVLRLERTGTSAGGGFIYANVNEMFGVTDGTLYPFLVKQGAPTESLVVASSGNVGIGTGNPSNLLHLKASSNPVLRLEGASDSGYVDYNGTRLQLSAGGGAIYFVSGNTERVRIDSSGNVGIGTTSPSCRLDLGNGGNNQVFQVDNGVNANLQFVFSSGLATIRNTGGSSSLALQTGITERLRIDPSGNVGIGTTSPQSRFHVFGGDIMRTNSDYVNGSAGSGFVITGLASSGATDAQLYAFRGGNTSYGNIVIPGGNLGIGTTSPTQPLHVNGNATAADFILTSDRRLKRDLVEITGALATVLSWAGYTYRPVDSDRRRAGLMAQDVEPTAPELVYTGEDGYKSLSYEQAVPYLVEAIRDLHRMIEALA